MKQALMIIIVIVSSGFIAGIGLLFYTEYSDASSELQAAILERQSVEQQPYTSYGWDGHMEVDPAPYSEPNSTGGNDTLVEDVNEWTILDANFVPIEMVSYANIFGTPTHECPVHGPIGYMAENPSMAITYDGEEYQFCGDCAMKYIAGVLKENIPQITKISKEKQND